MSHISVRVPASTANVGPGYDVFGIALSLYNTISLEQAKTLDITVSGSKADESLPLDENNLVFKSIQAFYRHINKPCPNFKINIDCQIPLASGLGSSSTAIVGGLALANKLEGEPLDTDSLITLAWQLEGHPDNTTTAILGGFVLSTITADNVIAYKKLLWPSEWKLIICHPDFKLSTQEARAVIPKSVSVKDAVFNMSCCSFLVAAVCTKDEVTLKRSLNDRLHQPYRAKLVPGLMDIINSLQEQDILGTVLSGAGPSICIITNHASYGDIIQTVSSIWNKEGIECEFFYPQVDNEGLYFNETHI